MGILICLFCHWRDGWHTPFCTSLGGLHGTEMHPEDGGPIRLRKLPAPQPEESPCESQA